MLVVVTGIAIDLGRLLLTVVQFISCGLSACLLNEYDDDDEFKSHLPPNTSVTLQSVVTGT